jgi:hypothetical protein
MEEDNIDVKQVKKEWRLPTFEVIPFKSTKNGTVSSVEEDLGGTVKTIS